MTAQAAAVEAGEFAARLASRNRWRWAAAMLLVLAIALALRVPGLNWDGGRNLHPDERAIAFAAERVDFAHGKIDPDFFAYGSLPIYLISLLAWAGAALGGAARDYDGAIQLGRAISVAAAALTIAWLALMGRRLAGAATGALAALLLALLPLHVQSSRFATVDALLTLLASIAVGLFARYAVSGRRGELVLGSVAAGLALATKATAIVLLVPLAVAILHVARRPGGPAGWRLAARAALLGLPIVALAFLCAEPMALLRPERVLADLAEQSRIVREAGIVPYTLQYLGSRRFVDPLLQMALWTVGPLTWLAACAGIVHVVRRRLRDRRESPAAAVWLSWVAALFLAVGGLPVQFPRQLLPIYPALALFAALGLTSLAARRARLGQAAIALVVAVALAQAAAIASIAHRPHTFAQASTWLGSVAAEGSRFLFPDWDEGLAMEPAASAKGFVASSFNFYDRPDDAAKLERLSAALAQVDYLVFPTRRIYGSIARAGDRFPVSEPFLRLLFAGRAGFTLERTFSSRPSFLNLELPDELGDESLSAYDHPRVLVFRRTETVPSDELARRIAALLPGAPPSGAAMLRAEAADAAGRRTDAAPEPRPAATVSTARSIVLFFGAAELAALAGFAWLSRFGRGALTCAVSRVAGPFVAAWLAWLAVSWQLIRLERVDLLLFFALLAAVSALFAGRDRSRRPPLRTWLLTGAVAAAASGLALLARAAEPAIFWGEKPMDHSILAQLARAASLPPADPWFAGSPLHYSYFGHWVVAFLGQISGVPSAISYNLGVALFAGLAASAALAAGLALGRRRGIGLAVVVFVLLLGNLSGPFLWGRFERLGFDYFWATSRVIPDTINEYPFWSFLFADLHAHVMALPLLLLALALAVTEARGELRDVRLRWRFAAWGFLTGALAATSSWSLVSAFALAGAAALAGALATPSRRAATIAMQSALGVVATAAIAFLFFAPHWLSLPHLAAGFGIERGRTATWAELGLLHGLPTLILLPRLVRLWLEALSPRPGRRHLEMVLVATLAAAALAVAGGAPRGLPLLLALLGVRALLSRRIDASDRGLLLVASVAFGLIGATENFFLWDRMNTVFKYGFDGGVLLSVAAGSEAWRWLHRERRGSESVSPLGRWLPRALLALGVALALATSVTAAWGKLREPRVPGPSWTLDGLAYLETQDPELSATVSWLQALKGSPRVLEAWGPSYGASARISALTGLPAPLGWDYHVSQRGHSWEEIERRKRAIAAVYRADSGAAVRAALLDLGVDFVVFGPLERETYGEAGGSRLAAMTDRLQPLNRIGQTAIYRVRPPALSGATPAASGPGGITAGTPPSAAAEVDPQTAAVLPLREPRGVVWSAGAYWVADFGNSRLARFDARLRPLAPWSAAAAGSGPLRQPCAVSRSRDGLLVADTWNHRVLRLGPAGELIAIVEAGLFGPRGVAEDPESGDLFVSDTGNHRVLRLSRDGEVRLSWGHRGAGVDQLDDPVGLAMAPDGSVVVADNGNGRLRRFGPDGELRRDISVPGWRLETYSEPQIAIGSDGVIWITVPLEGEIRGYTPEGAPLARRRLESVPGAERRIPLGIALSPDERALAITTLDGELLELAVADLRTR